MNVYDTANRLASEIKQSKEFIEYKKIKEEVEQNAEWKQKLQDFEKMKYEVQMQTIQEKANQEEVQKKIIEMQNIYTELMQNEKIKLYFDAEYKFNVLMVDINKIISEAVKEIIK